MLTAQRVETRAARGPSEGSRRLHTSFIVGPPRSGTTLLGYLLGGGERVLSLSEPFLAHAIQPDWKLQQFFCSYQKSAGLRRLRPPYRGSAEQFADFLRHMALENGFRRLVIKETYRRDSQSPDWCNEPLLTRLVSGAEPVMGLIRHPRDVAASTIKLCRWVTGPRGWLLRFRWSNLPTFRDATQVVRWAVDNWVAWVGWSRRHKLSLVRYEDIVREPEKQLRVLCQRCGIEFNQGMLDTTRHRAAFGGLGDFSVLRAPRPVDRDSVGHGRRLTNEQRQIVRDTCGELAGEWHYEF